MRAQTYFKRAHFFKNQNKLAKRKEVKERNKKIKNFPKFRNNSKKFVTSFENREEIKPLIKVIEFNFLVSTASSLPRAALPH